MSEIESGAKYDTGKPMMDCIPPGPLFEIADIFTRGAEKYDKHNWCNGISYSRLYAAIQRHLNKFWMGVDTDPEWGTRHLAHAACGLMMLMSMPKEFDDRVFKDMEIPEYVREIIER